MKLTTVIERDFLYVGESNFGEKLYRECINHYIVVIDANNKSTKKLDKKIAGGIFKEDNVHFSPNGVYMHTFSDGQTRRLVAV